ncbi:hypothetical protein BOX15_Mlig014012g1 [Macrostomum lignano]|uniref:Succinyl-CoA:3-ketoacid-coenzyme A transferase n=1 Tax=Macrostomum lignano TaxID=282301 RepID=A0A267F655_9PLAT|nr:hypothetical protein BOX15_Mlig014012g1 [Macrostomum lignano]
MVIEYDSCLEAVLSNVHSGCSVMVGGFGHCGSPEGLLAQVLQSGAEGLTLISGTGGSPDSGLGRLISRRRVQSLLTTYIGANREIYQRHLLDQLELQLLPQGTFAERIRAGGSGLAAFYTRAGVGTAIANGGVPLRYGPDGGVLEVTAAKETRLFDGVEHVLETALKADVALVKAWRADRAGNLQFRMSANNFNGIMCQAARVAIAEVEEIVDCGQLPADQIHVPSVFVQGLVLAEKQRPEARRVLKRATSRQQQPALMTIARRVAAEFKADSFANVGLGIPMLAASCVPRGLNVFLHSENGVLGLGPYPSSEADFDPDLINASRESVTLRPGAVCFDSATSFAIVSGGHLSMTVLGANQVSQFGDIANWIIPGAAAVGMGGAMELVSCGIRVVAAMRHCTVNGQPKILSSCTLPLTGRRCVDLIVTDLAVFSVDKNRGLTLLELADGVTVSQVAACTDCHFAISDSVQPVKQVVDCTTSELARV